jgi:hypothetical protein
MGDVYQARDTKLGRSVAIKFLPEAFSHDTERVARFQREARVLASLNHPNIAAIHGVEEIDTRYFLVMELVPGETLADRIKRGAIPIDEALPIAKQIAEALEEAHEKGIVHRDLKPANIRLVGSPVPVSGQIAGDRSNTNTSLIGFSYVTASSNGLLAYRLDSGRTHLVVLDRSGHETAEIPDSEFTLQFAAVSPDQRTLGVTRDIGGNVDVWLLDISRGLPRRMTTDTAFDGRPIWSPDGKQFAFVSNRKGVFDIYLKSVDANDEKPLLESPTGKVVDDWSSDGKFILYQESGLKTQDDLWAVPLSGDRKPFVVLQTPNMEYAGRFSPDTHSIAYMSNETGRNEVYSSVSDRAPCAPHSPPELEGRYSKVISSELHAGLKNTPLHFHCQYEHARHIPVRLSSLVS